MQGLQDVIFMLHYQPVKTLMKAETAELLLRCCAAVCWCQQVPLVRCAQAYMCGLDQNLPYSSMTPGTRHIQCDMALAKLDTSPVVWVIQIKRASVKQGR